jgi:hypothetical protein
VTDKLSLICCFCVSASFTTATIIASMFLTIHSSIPDCSDEWSN